jgi:ribonuclease HI
MLAYHEHEVRFANDRCTTELKNHTRMSAPQPHFLLYSTVEPENKQGQWKFVLQAADGSATLEAEDSEPATHGERLELLTVVRGLEALDQPSQVTLITSSRYVNRGLTYGLEEWRRNDWTWESFGEMVPVKHQDLWQRLDRALRFHRLEVRPVRVDGAHGLAGPHGGVASGASVSPNQRPAVGRPHFRLPNAAGGADTAPTAAVASRSPRRAPLVARIRHRVRDRLERMKLSLAQLGTSWLPRPWLG